MVIRILMSASKFCYLLIPQNSFFPTFSKKNLLIHIRYPWYPNVYNSRQKWSCNNHFSQMKLGQSKTRSYIHFSSWLIDRYLTTPCQTDSKIYTYTQIGKPLPLTYSRMNYIHIWNMNVYTDVPMNKITLFCSSSSLTTSLLETH